MADTIVKDQRLSRQRRRDTGPELELRRHLHRLGLRYRLHRRVVPGAPRREVDIVFGPQRVAVAVLGCFWHGCPSHARLPIGDTRPWWESKLAANRQRDDDSRRRLEADGWLVFEVWECDEPARAATRIAEAVGCRTPVASPS